MVVNYEDKPHGEYLEDSVLQDIDSTQTHSVKMTRDKLEHWLTGLAISIRKQERLRAKHKHQLSLPISILIGTGIPLISGQLQEFLGLSADFWKGVLSLGAFLACLWLLKIGVAYIRPLFSKSPSQQTDESQIKTCIDMIQSNKRYDIYTTSDT